MAGPWTTFAQASELATAEQSQALCDNNVDAIVFTVGHPSGTIQEATTSCESHIMVPVQKARSSTSLIADNPFYAYSTIPGGMYANNPDDIVTFGVKATFVTTTALSEEAVYTIVKRRCSRTSKTSSACTRPIRPRVDAGSDDGERRHVGAAP